MEVEAIVRDEKQLASGGMHDHGGRHPSSGHPVREVSGQGRHERQRHPTHIEPPRASALSFWNPDPKGRPDAVAQMARLASNDNGHW